MPRQYQILADWQPEQEYQLTIDSLAFIGVYGLHTDKVQQTVKVKKMDEYGTILLNIKGGQQICLQPSEPLDPGICSSGFP